MRSGVNCSRLASRSSDAAMAFTNRVLAVPGTPSSSTWPRTSSAATMPESVPSCPTTTLPTSSRRARIGPRGSRAGSLAKAGCSGGSAMEDLRADLVDVSGEVEELVLGANGVVGDGAGDLVAIGAAAAGGDLGDHVGTGAGGQAEALAQPAAQVGPQQQRGAVRVVGLLHQVAHRVDQL